MPCKTPELVQVKLQYKTTSHLVQEDWNQLTEAIITTCEETIGHKKGNIKTGSTTMNRWWREKACEIQQLADANDTRDFFNAVKEIYGPSTHGQAPLKSKDGTTILKIDTKLGDRLKENFEDLLNHKVAIDRNVLNMIPKEAKEDSLAQILSLDEVRNTIKAMKNNKAAGPDGIPAEIYKFGGDVIQRQLHQLLTKIWINEGVPSYFRDANIITIYKQK
ncbi:uncharacterized protein LOC143028756 [Oratosquilla oratoria]|uniref:uncharacterized protein LOC143028756 n=1 Tax=Oratosquilla oratoria TaxID=337810 RepID=UPI003F75FF5E